jgi:hypothetical protein
LSRDDASGPIRKRDAAPLKKAQEFDERLFRSDIRGKSEGAATPTENDILRSQSLSRVEVLEILVMPDSARDDAELDVASTFAVLNNIGGKSRARVCCQAPLWASVLTL